MVIFDSSIVIDALRKKKSVMDLIESYAEKERIAITVISKYEILRGTIEKDISLVSELLSQFVIYDLEDSGIREAVKSYKRLAEKGKLVNDLDVLIAGIASANNETLITKDKDFLSFENVKIIVL
ncbi:MAG: type II toxin-antitoxin system VapC family toxin [Candidatus Bathyarchaeia archaeon]|jgi:tRNA(fMet)-specific endonuclease VapC